MYIKKLYIISIGTIAFFLIYWMICNISNVTFIQTDIGQIYDQHGITAGYFSLRSFLALYIVPLLLYNNLILEQEKDYIAIRYNTRKKIWFKKMLNLFMCNFHFTCLYFFVDVVFMLATYPIKSIISSRILIYLIIYFPVVFLFFSLISIIFMELQICFSNWKALVFVFVLCIVCYFLTEFEILQTWHPFYFLFLLSKQMQGGMMKGELMLSYTTIIFFNAFFVIVGLKLYEFKEFLKYEE